MVPNPNVPTFEPQVIIKTWLIIIDVGSLILFITSRKLCLKKIAAKIGCGSFDQLDLESLNDCKFPFLFCDCILRIPGRVICYWKGIFKGLSNIIAKVKIK